MADIEIEIDGRTLTAKPNQMVIEVADAAGIYIPRFCYHKHLSVAANCRMCLVEMEKSPKAVPACATPVMPGMKIFTKSAKTVAAQRAVMEFLLINHPLDCPVCDQGGECELQDLAMGYGASKSNYDECKRAVPDPELGPLVATEMTRCIYCTRCVRYGTEVAGMREIGGAYRGEHTEITTFVKHAMQSEVSGNIIDLCPVGALTSKPYRFTARAWEMKQAPGVSPHDCLGTNVNIHSINNVVKRVVSRENSDINLTWISDRDRFAYEGLYHTERLQEPMIRMHGEWKVVDWQHAFEVAANGLQHVISKTGANSLGALASPNATVEEHYLLQKIMRALGSANIDHRLRETDTADQAAMELFPGLGMSVSGLESADSVLLIGSNLQKEQPVAALRLRNAIKKGAVVTVVNPMDYDFNFAVKAKQIVAPHHLTQALAEVVVALGGTVTGFKSDKTLAESAQSIAAQLKEKNESLILLGALAMHHEQASTLRALARQIASLTNAKLGYLTDGANGAGAWIAGAVPHRLTGGATIASAGLDATAMFAQPRDGYVLLNVEPDKDLANAGQALKALSDAQFVVALSMYRNAVLDEHADVILPISAFTETSGTFVSTAGVWQNFKGVTKPVGASRPAWKVLRVLGNFLHLEGFDYESAEDVIHEVTLQVEKSAPCKPATFTLSHDALSSRAGISRVGEIPIYATDSLVRRSLPLQETQLIMEGESAVVRMNAATANQHRLHSGGLVNIQQGEFTAILPVLVDERVPADAVWVAGGIEATSQLGNLFGEVTMTQVTHVS